MAQKLYTGRPSHSLQVFKKLSLDEALLILKDKKGDKIGQCVCESVQKYKYMKLFIRACVSIVPCRVHKILFA